MLLGSWYIIQMIGMMYEDPNILPGGTISIGKCSEQLTSVLLYVVKNSR